MAIRSGSSDIPLHLPATRADKAARVVKVVRAARVRTAKAVRAREAGTAISPAAKATAIGVQCSATAAAVLSLDMVPEQVQEIPEQQHRRKKKPMRWKRLSSRPS